MLELDCHLTKDKQVVVAHDSCLLRTTGQNLYVKDLLYDQLPLLKQSIKLDFEHGIMLIHFSSYKLLSLNVFVGKEYHGSEDENLRKIPLLKDVFETFPNVQVNIDVKEGSDELIEQIGKLITAYNREKSTVWGSFKEDASLKCFNQVLYTILNFYFLLLPSFLEFVSYFLLEPRSRTLFLSQRCSQAVSLLLHWSPTIYFIQGNTFRNPAFYQRYQ